MAKTKMKFKAGKAKDPKKVKDNLKKGSGYGNMLWIKADSSKVVRMLVEPKDWEEYNYVVVEETDSGKKLGFKGKLPLYDGVEEQVPEAGRQNPRVGYVIPVVVIEDGKPQDRVMWWEPKKGQLNELLTIFEKRKTLTDRDVEIIREGSGRENTSYTFFWEDPKKRSKVMAMADDAPDFADELVTMVNDFMALYDADSSDDDDDEDEEPRSKSKKSKGKSSAAKRRAMVDDDDDDEDEEEEEEDDDSDEESEDEDDDEGEDGPPSKSDLEAMDFKALKALAKEHDVEVPKGAKSAGYRKAILAHFEDAEDPDDDDEGDDDDAPETTDGAVTGVFVVQEIDEQAFTVDLVHKSTGEVFETVYLDRSRDDVDVLKEGASYTTTVEKDDEDDWITTAAMKPAKSKK